MDELPLFPAPSRDERWTRLRDAAARLAAQGILIGTSSWKYPGWMGWLYTRDRYLTRGTFSQARFERECLREYAEVFSTVSVDAGYYTFPTAPGIQKLCDQVPDGFRFSFKVTDEITLPRFPRLPRFGPRAGRDNPHFLDASLFQHAFLAPLDPHRSRIGVLMFEFSRFPPDTWPTPTAFADALDEFFARLPDGWAYGVELRNPELLHPDYFATLARHRVAHVLNNWQAMPSVGDQLDIPGILTTDFTAARFLLKPGRAYEQAVTLFSPYDQLREPVPEARAAARRLIRTLAESKSTKSEPATPAAPAPSPSRRHPPSSYIFVNNRLEGHALESLLAITADA